MDRGVTAAGPSADGSRRAAGGERIRYVRPAPALPAADLDPDQRPVRRVVEVALLDDPVEDLLRDHQDERRGRGLLQRLFQRRRLQQTEGGVEVIAVEALVVLVDLAGVHHGPQPHPQLRPGDRGVVLGEQGGQGRYQLAEHQRLRHIVVRLDQDQHAVAAIGERLQVPGGDPGRLERLVEQLVQELSQLALGGVVALGRSLDVDSKDQAVHRIVEKPRIQAGRYRREQNAHLPSPQVTT